MKPGRVRAPLDLLRERARCARRCRSSPSAASRRTMRRALVEAGADALAVITALFHVADTLRRGAGVRRACSQLAHATAEHRCRPMKSRNRDLVRAVPAGHPRRRQFAGARVPLGRRHAGVLPAREGLARLGRRRQGLHRLCRLLGPAGARPCAPRGGRGGAAGGRAGPELRRAHRSRVRDGRAAVQAAALAASWCGW